MTTTQDEDDPREFAWRKAGTAILRNIAARAAGHEPDDELVRQAIIEAQTIARMPPPGDLALLVLHWFLDQHTKPARQQKDGRPRRQT